MQAPAETAPGQRSIRWKITLPQLWVFCVVAIPVVASLAAQLSAVDLAYNIRAGQVMVETHHLLRMDMFTFTGAGQPWLDQQWAGQILLALLHTAGGWVTLALVRAAMVGAIFWLVYRSCRDAGAGVHASCALGLASFLVASEGLSLRPQLMGMLLFALTAWIVTGRTEHPRRLWWVPVLVLVWANVHGSFFLGPLILALAWIEDRAARAPIQRRTFRVFLLSIAATFFTPFGPRVWEYVVSLSTNPLVTRNIEEWQPPHITDYTGAAFFISVMLVVAVLVRTRSDVTWPTLLSLGIFFVIGLTAVRGAYWWALYAPILIAPLTVSWPPPRRSRRRRHRGPDTGHALNTVVAAFLVLLGVSFLPGLRDANPLAPGAGPLSDAPAGITARLHDLVTPGEAFFNPQRWGSWFELALPDNPVATDSRIEVIPEDAWAKYTSVSLGQDGWQQILNDWNVNVVVADPEQQGGLISRIAGDPEWRLAYQDADGWIFVRR